MLFNLTCKYCHLDEFVSLYHQLCRVLALFCYAAMHYFIKQAYQVCCCVKEAPPTPTYNIICLGISNAGKTTLLTILKFENPDAIVPTIGKVIGMLIEFVKSNAFHLCMAGFSVKDILLPNATLKVKELGGTAICTVLFVFSF